LQIQDPLKDFRGGLKALQIQDPMKDLREGLRALQIQDPLKDFREGVRALQAENPLKVIRAVLSGISYGLELQQVSPDAVPVDESDGFATGVDAEDVAASLDRLATHVRDDPSNVAGALAAVIAEIRGLKDTRLQRVIYLLIIPLLIGLCSSLVQPIIASYVERHFGLDDKKVVPAVEYLVGQAVTQPRDLERVRIVRAPGAQVRSGRKGRSTTVASLRPGHVVFVLQKRGRWTLVGFSDEERNAQGYGWVRSKRLKPISLR
jgi:hypothetical protein